MTAPKPKEENENEIKTYSVDVSGGLNLYDSVPNNQRKEYDARIGHAGKQFVDAWLNITGTYARSRVRFGECDFKLAIAFCGRRTNGNCKPRRSWRCLGFSGIAPLPRSRYRW